MLELRPFIPSDADEIVSWLGDEQPSANGALIYMKATPYRTLI